MKQNTPILNQLDPEVLEVAKALQTSADRLRSLETTLAERDEVLRCERADRAKEAAEHDKKLKRLERAREEKENALAEVRRTLGAEQRRASALERKLTETETSARLQLDRVIGEKEWMKSQRSESADAAKKDRAARLNAEKLLQDSQDALGDSNRLVAVGRQRVADLEQQFHERERQMEAILDSKRREVTRLKETTSEFATTAKTERGKRVDREKELGEVKEALALAERRREIEEERASEAEGTVESLRAQLDRMTAKRNSQVGELRRDLTAAKRAFAPLAAEKDDLATRLHQADADRERALRATQVRRRRRSEARRRVRPQNSGPRDEAG